MDAAFSGGSIAVSNSGALVTIASFQSVIEQLKFAVALCLSVEPVLRCTQHLTPTHGRRAIGQIDMLIAAIAMTLGNTTVVSGDSDLKAVSGLTIENWAIP